MDTEKVTELRERAATASVNMGRGGKRFATSSADPQANKLRRRRNTEKIQHRGVHCRSVESNEALPEVEPHALVQIAGLGQVEGHNEIAVDLAIPDGTPPLIFHPDERVDMRIQTVFQLWLRGYTRGAIQHSLKLTRNVVRGDLSRIKDSIRQFMAENPEVFGGPLQVLVMQIARRRDRQMAMWEELPDAPPQTRPQYYKLISEEDTAVERLLGLDKKTLEVILGSPEQHARGHLMKTLGPEGLKDLLAEIRETHQVITGQSQIVIRDGVGVSAPATDQSRGRDRNWDGD